MQQFSLQVLHPSKFTADGYILNNKLSTMVNRITYNLIIYDFNLSFSFFGNIIISIIILIQISSLLKEYLMKKKTMKNEIFRQNF